MRLYKSLTILLLSLLLSSAQAWSAEPQYTRAQVDSIVAAEVARQLKDQQIELQIERVSNEKYAKSLDEQNNRLVKHEGVMTGLYGFFALVVAAFGFAVPYMQNKRYEKRLNAIAEENSEKISEEIEVRTKEYEKRLNAIAEENGKKISKEIAARTEELDDKIAAHDKAINELVKEAAESKKAAAKSMAEAEESAKQAKASEYFSQAYAEKDLDKKIDLYTKAIKLKPDYAEAYNNRGCAYDDNGEYDKAIDDYGKAIELKPDYAEAYNNRGNAYSDKGEYDKAIADYTKAIELKPDFAVAYNNRGELRYKMGDYKGAIEDCSRAIELDSDGVKSESYYHRSLSYKALGGEENLKLALADAQKGLEVARRLGSRSLVKEEEFVKLIKDLGGGE